MSEKILTLENTREAFLEARKLMDEIQSEKEALDKAKADYLEKAEQDFLAEHAQEFIKIADAVAKFNKANTNYRQEILLEHNRTKEKQVDEYSSVRLDKKIEYSSDDAFKWCMEHKLGLTVDKKTFESFIKASKNVKIDFPFVKISEVPTPVIKK